MQSKPFQKQDIVAPNHQTLSTCHIMANLKVSCIDRHCCNTLLIKAVIAPVMQSGYEDEDCAAWMSRAPEGLQLSQASVSRLPSYPCLKGIEAA